MKTGSGIFMVGGVLFLAIAAFNASKAPNVDYLIGTFLPGLICIIVGLVLGQTKKPKTSTPLTGDERIAANNDPRQLLLQAEAKRANTFKFNANVGIIAGIVLMFLAGSMAQNEEGPFPIAWIVSLGGFALEIWGCVNYMRWKGYSGWFGFFGYLFLLGLVILVCFPNRRKRILQRNDSGEIETLSKRDHQRGSRFLLALAPVVIFSIFFCVLIFFAGSNIKAAQWEGFAPEGMGFQVLMPGTPQFEQNTQETPVGTVEIRKFTAWPKGKGKSEFFMVVLAQFPENVGRQLGGTQKLLEAGRNDVLTSCKGRVRNQSNIFLNGWPGLELEVLTDGSIVTARIFALKGQIYEVWAWVPRVRSKSDDVQRFLDSFKLLEQPAVRLD
jgi:hypothetical protein